MPDARPPPPLAPAVLLPLLPGYGVLCTEDVCAEKQKYHRQRAAAVGLTGRWDRVASRSRSLDPRAAAGWTGSESP